MEITEIKRILKGKWEYNLTENKLICKQKETVYIFENKDVLFYQKILAHLKKGIPNPNLNPDLIENFPNVQIPFETFHRVLRACITLYEPTLQLKTCKNGLYGISDHIQYQINHNKYPKNCSVLVDPQQLYVVSRSFRNRERVRTKLLLMEDQVILNCDFPWVNLTIKIPTINKGDMIKNDKK